MRIIERGAFRGNKESAKFSNAKGIANALAAMLTSMPINFRRSDIVEKLGIKTQREVSLLTDALYLLKQKRLISWNPDAAAWKNLVR